MNRRDRIAELQRKRAFYLKLGKRKKVIQIDAVLVPLMTEELRQERAVAQVREDLEWLAGNKAA